MSRFGATGTFTYAADGVLLSGTVINLAHDEMPQYPFREYAITDKENMRTKGGVAYSYQNYNKRGLEFVWSSLNETTRDELKGMFDANAIFNFNSGGTNFGTFIFAGDWEDEEVSFELFDVSFEAVEK